MNPWMQMGVSLLTGIILGTVYRLLRPLRRRHRNCADGIFVLCCTWAWIEVCFGMFRSDLPFACIPAAAAGGFLWHRLLRGRLKP